MLIDHNDSESNSLLLYHSTMQLHDYTSSEELAPILWRAGIVAVAIRIGNLPIPIMDHELALLVTTNLPTTIDDCRLCIAVDRSFAGTAFLNVPSPVRIWNNMM